MASEQTIRGGDLISVHLVSAGLRVDDDELAFILRTEPEADLALVDPVASPGELFLTVARTYISHTLPRHSLIGRTLRNALCTSFYSIHYTLLSPI